MKVTMLMENKAGGPQFCRAHGLSILVEALGKTILFDAGPDTGYAQNARTLGVDLTAVDFAVLSHAHWDHSGGLLDFMSRNRTAPLYLSREAFGEYYAIENGVEEYAGVDKALAAEPRLVYSDGELEIMPGITLFSLPAGSPRRLWAKVNNVLYKRTPKGDVHDSFAHEQNLLIRENGFSALLSGCAHSGIVNILERAEQLNGGELDVVLGGFHLQDPDSLRAENDALLLEIADELAARKTRYYAFHCTGDGPFEVLKQRLEGRIEWLSAGQSRTFL